MAVVGLDGSWHQVNRSLCAMFGYSAAELCRLTFHAITHPDDLDLDLDLVRECLAGRRDQARTLTRYLHADGRVVWGDRTVVVVRDEHGPVDFLAQVVDVTAQRADRARLEQVLGEVGVADRDLARFAAVISHDLKTPLATIQATLELLGDVLPSAEDDAASTAARALAARAEAAAERMAGLIDAVLAYSTTDPRLADGAGSHAGATRTLLPDLVATALADVQALLDRGGTRVDLETSFASAPAVLAVPALVRTVLVNLLANAVTYRDPDRVLTAQIGAEWEPEPPPFVCVTVRNDGPGIPTAERDRLFTLFSRGVDRDDATSAPAFDMALDGVAVPGFGIGLAACRRIVSWHGGRIWFEDPDPAVGPDRGVVVRFTLPLPRSP